jgi:iron(II)-dependent oxidoreductase
MAHTFNSDKIASLMQESRDHTHRLLDLVISESDLRREPAPGFRPILWHLGHVGAFEEYWILQQLSGDPSISETYGRVFDPIKTPKEDARRLPPIPEIEEYLKLVRGRVLKALATAGDRDHPMLRDGYIFNLVIEHEYQHQETLGYLLQILETGTKRKPEGFGSHRNAADPDQPPADATAATDPGPTPSADSGSMIAIPGGPFELGSRGYPFAYDNEQPPHFIDLPDFRIGKYPVTNAEYAEFIRAGGYQTRSLWDEAGWAWREENRVELPLYWSPGSARFQGADDAGARSQEVFIVQEMFEERPIRPDAPVTGVSWHEARAYARWAGKRLPSEAEWEKAASWDPIAGRKRQFSWGDDEPSPELANFASLNWATTPVSRYPGGRSAYGCWDMTGNVWEWTATVFGGYPGFEAYPYPDYSELWFDGDHRVLKGGAWGTQSPLLRCSFRNFFRARFRHAVAGFRLAAD